MTKKLVILSLSLFVLNVLSASEKAYFAGGCFWSMQKFFDNNVAGVVATTVGYSGGTLDNPDYGDVSTGTTGHRETIEVVYDPKVTSYAKLINAFWHDIDPTSPTGTFCDNGSEYISAIFYRNADEKKVAEEAKKKLSDSKMLQKPVMTDLLEFKKFWPAEKEHQKYWKEHSIKYEAYKLGCGRDKGLESVWGKYLNTDFKKPQPDEAKAAEPAKAAPAPKKAKKTK